MIYTSFFICLTISLFQPALSQNQNECNMQPSFCDYNKKYRSIDGSCNNLEKPYLGKQNRPYKRAIPNSYADGVYSLTRMLSGAPLPSARVISNLMFPEAKIANKRYTLALMQMGQIIAHDLSFNGPFDDSDGCCNAKFQPGPKSGVDDKCADIDIPKNDPDYNTTDWKCLPLPRTQKASAVGCPTKNLDGKVTTVTSYLDLSIIYGSDDDTNSMLRSYHGGKLNVRHKDGYTYPLNGDDGMQRCFRAQSSKEPCYFMGDVRANQNPQLTSLHIVFYNEHNRIAEVLSLLNPRWDDEKIYQEARRINIAQYQHIVYHEILPGYIGKENMVHNELLYPDATCCVDDYSPHVDPSIYIEFAVGAYRHFHSLIVGDLNLYNANRQQVGRTDLSDYEFRPIIQELNSTFNIHALLRGLSIQPSGESDEFFTPDIKSKFEPMPPNKLGSDLVSIDIERNRDHGNGRYYEARKWCGLDTPSCWDDIDFISDKNIIKLQTLYETPEDMELYVAGALETVIVPDSLMGETFHCIITRQFYNVRKGDRFHYENCESNKFTTEQLQTIKKASLGRILCDNSKMYRIQPRATELVSDSNPVVPCNSLPKVNLNLWKDTSSDNRSYKH